MIDYDKFKYRVGDKVRKIELMVEPSEYVILKIEEKNRYGKPFRHYQLKNLTPGCVDAPSWQSQNVVHQFYEPCNPAAKLLFKKNTSGLEYVDKYKREYLGSFGNLIVSTPRNTMVISNMSDQSVFVDLNRAELAKPDSHSLDALRYSVLGQPSKKVSR